MMKGKYYSHLLLFESSIQALADDFSLDFEWQRISLSLLDFPQYSG